MTQPRQRLLEGTGVKGTYVDDVSFSPHPDPVLLAAAEHQGPAQHGTHVCSVPAGVAEGTRNCTSLSCAAASRWAGRCEEGWLGVSALP